MNVRMVRQEVGVAPLMSVPLEDVVVVMPEEEDEEEEDVCVLRAISLPS